jgi:hypothetical protein
VTVNPPNLGVQPVPQAISRVPAPVIEITEDEWIAKYKPIPRPDVVASGRLPEYFSDYMYETYGDAYQAIARANPLTVWTLIDVESGDEEGEEGDEDSGDDDESGFSMLITNGNHHVNRIGYYLTEVPFESLDQVIQVVEQRAPKDQPSDEQSVDLPHP